MKKTTLLLFLIGVSFFGCTGNETSSIGIMSDLATDFPTSEKLEFKYFNKYDSLFEEDGYLIDGSVLWHFSRRDKQNIGYCYDLNTGKKLSTIASKGRARNEFFGASCKNTRITNDSINIYVGDGGGGTSGSVTGGTCTIKTFAVKDIIENKPMGERKFSVTESPANIYVAKIAKLPNGSGVATLLGSMKPSEQEESDINRNSVAIFNDKGVKGYQTLDYESFDIKLCHSSIEPNFLIKTNYGMGNIVVKNNDIAAFSPRFQIILYTLDLNSGKVMNEKRYTKMVGGENSFLGINEMRIDMINMASNDKHIFCIVSGYLSKEDKELKQKKTALFVFDWDLKPIKRFELPNIYGHRIIISQDCNSIYISERTEEGLVLTKADLNI